jgi:hypothetical protein
MDNFNLDISSWYTFVLLLLPPPFLSCYDFHSWFQSWSRIWFCFICVTGSCSTILMFYIFTLICRQRVAIVLVCFFYHDGGFWFGRYVIFDNFVIICCSMYCDIIVLILSWLYTFLILYLCILCHCDTYCDMACTLCISVLFVDKFGI